MHGFGLALVIIIELPFGNMELFLGDNDITLVERLEIAQIACDSEAVSGMHEAVDAGRTLTAVGYRIDGILRAGGNVSAAEDIRVIGLPCDLGGLYKAAVMCFDLRAFKDITPVSALTDGNIYI